MANSYTEVTLSSAQTVGFTTPAYVVSSHLTVRVNGVVVPKTTGVGKIFGSFTATNNLFYTIVEGQTTISFSEQLPSGAVVKISRSTSPDTKLVNYVDNTLITAKLLNEDSNQSFFLSQEALEGTTIGDITGNVTGNVSGSAATVTTAAQPSITSVGTLTGLDVSATKITLTDTTAGSTTENPSLELYRNGGAGADGHEIGAVKFFGNNDAGTPEKIEYAKIYSEIIDNTDGTEDGSLKFHLISNGSIEDPVMTLQQFGLIMASGNSIYLGANGTLSFEGTDETNNLETAIVATNPTADRTITLPDATGTVVLNSSGVISETATKLELTSTTATSTTENPTIELYRNGGATSDLHELGALKFFGQNDANQKVEYGSIYTEIDDASDGTEDGEMRFHLMTGGTVEDPVMTLKGYGIVMGAGNHIYLNSSGGKIFYYDSANTSRYYELTSPSNTGIANGTTSFELPSGTNNGTLAVTGATNTAEFFEISSATAPTADNAAHPVISLYDSSDRSSLANTVTNGQEHTGAIRWYFNNDAGNKSFLGAIRGIVRDSEDGAERGSIEFTLPTGSAGDTVTDVTAAHSNVESPIVTLHKYGLVMASGNDIFFSAAADVLEWDTGSHKQSIRGRSSESTGGNSVLELPDASGTMAHIATNGGLQHPSLSSAPSSPVNGQTYYNTSTHKLQLYANGAWVDLN